MFSDCDKDGHYIFLGLELANSNYIIVNVYGFNSQTENIAYIDSLERRLLHSLSKFPNSSVILGGDFNTVLDNHIDRWPSRSSDSASSYMKMFADRLDLTDT